MLSNVKAVPIIVIIGFMLILGGCQKDTTLEDCPYSFPDIKPMQTRMDQLHSILGEDAEFEEERGYWTYKDSVTINSIEKNGVDLVESVMTFAFTEELTIEEVVERCGSPKFAELVLFIPVEPPPRRQKVYYYPEYGISYFADCEQYSCSEKSMADEQVFMVHQYLPRSTTDMIEEITSKGWHGEIIPWVGLSKE